ncbi:hypothetical protein Vafri_20359 [Volvox africanus]|uniref:Uncharacterized protein n=1 Tax=Volvox africanus TaxID=51714 RepID=A0A8J4BQP6_9CHLO|nr:hypothetical protein Vafri_20359 [Volvox africanus]
MESNYVNQFRGPRDGTVDGSITFLAGRVVRISDAAPRPGVRIQYLPAAADFHLNALAVGLRPASGHLGLQSALGGECFGLQLLYADLAVLLHTGLEPLTLQELPPAAPMAKSAIWAAEGGIVPPAQESLMRPDTPLSRQLTSNGANGGGSVSLGEDHLNLHPSRSNRQRTDAAAGAGQQLQLQLQQHRRRVEKEPVGQLRRACSLDPRAFDLAAHRHRIGGPSYRNPGNGLLTTGESQIEVACRESSGPRLHPGRTALLPGGLLSERCRQSAAVFQSLSGMDPGAASPGHMPEAGRRRCEV